MQTIDNSELSNVCGGESFGQVIGALRSAPAVSAAETYGQTKDFIRDHEFFHQGLMNLPIGGGKHFRNVPFIGPGRIIGGVLGGSRDGIARGVETTRGTWDAQ